MNNYLYIFLFLTDIILVFIAIVVTYILLIFPIFIDIKGIYSHSNKRLYFGLYLYGNLKIFGGYIKVVKEGIAIHYTENKATILPYKNIFSVNQQIEPVRDYHIINTSILIEIGDSDSILKSMILGFTLNYVNNILYNYFSVKKPYLQINNGINIYEKKDILNIYAQFKIVFNLLMIVLSGIKMLVGVINENRTKRQSN